MHSDFLTPHAKRFRAVHQRTTRRAGGLIADDYHMGIAPPQVMLEVMADPTTGTHATTGDDNGARLILLIAIDSSVVRE